jgi:spore protease
MRITRTDLALEGVEQLQQGGDISRLDGVCAAEYTRHGYGVTDVRVATKQAAEAVGKPEGRYVTIDLRPYFRREEGFFARAARCLASELRTLLPGVGEDWPVLVAGLGNRGMTADAVGPLALESLLVTRHMVRSLPRQFRGFTPVSALVPGVLAATGMEALELLRGAVQATGCAAVIAVDALAARSRERLCATVQLGDTGLIPGSGVGNHRKAIDKTTLGVPVVAVGVPTVIAAHLLGDGQPEDDPLFLTPRDIDGKVRELGRVIGYGVTLALQEGLSVEDVTGLLG